MNCNCWSLLVLFLDYGRGVGTIFEASVMEVSTIFETNLVGTGRYHLQTQFI